MPRIPDAAMNAAFFLFSNREEAESGDGYGGSGFLVGRASDQSESRCTVYAVTNHHVAVQNGKSVIRLNKKDGTTEVVEADPAEWIFDPDGHDIAALPMPSIDPAIYKFNLIMTTLFATEEVIARHNIGPGENVFMAGRFIDADGIKKVNQPALRFGNISIMPVPMRQTRFNDQSHPSYCVDLHSRDGFSGSPVYVYRTIGQDLTAPNLNVGNQFIYLLGIHWAQFPEAWEIKTRQKASRPEARSPETVEYVDGLSGMTCVAPASAILKLLEQPKLRAPWDALNRTVALYITETGDPKLENFVSWGEALIASGRQI